VEPSAFPLLRELAPDLWVAEQSLRFLGLDVGARMTIIRLPGGGLFLHSPIARSDELAREVERIGRPTFLVAPNRFHHLYVGDWQAAYPDARLFVAPGLETKRSDLRVDEVLDSEPPPDWSEVLGQVPVRGFPFANEVVFFHTPSRTLVASDLVFNVRERSPTLTRIAFRLLGAYGRPSSSFAERLLIRDRPAFRESLDRILSWPISRIVLAHGDVVEENGRQALAQAYSWLAR